MKPIPILYHSRQPIALITKKVCQSQVDGVRNATVYMCIWSSATERSVTRCRSKFCKPTKLWTGDGDRSDRELLVTLPALRRRVEYCGRFGGDSGISSDRLIGAGAL